ncbi:PREDICTED: pleckstrin homology domain-containing family F member 1 [Gekko japonicus]|uniref:Pleckstrin homology domain-containing family F member 1 n=1 Tax=Gekko japonicus TaxID=146911 RepID=A0ABM1L6B9_GEKJA|nr:PREDICTED: pleckstrin homology domain-containing family F member 1 [Gekko japonicus]
MVDHLVNTEINSQRIAAVEHCFGASGQPLAVPGRVLLGEGILTKECRKKAKPRIFFLFNDLLVYGTIVINKRKYSSQHIIPLNEVTLETLPDTLQMKNRWMIKTSKKSFVVSAQPPTEHAAPWIPDKATDICMRCTQTKFSTLTRRHHCRKCGFVVCGECSRQKFLMPRLSPKPLRVCNLCYKQLMAEKKNTEEHRSQARPSDSPLVGYDPSSGDDSDRSDEDKLEQWPADTEFYTSEVPWSSFHR